MKYQTEWNLGLLYKNEKDPQIEKDIKILETACAAFEKKYRGKDFTSTAKKLLSALHEYVSVTDETHAKPWWYFALRLEKNSNDTVAQAHASRMQNRMTKAFNKTTFFLLQLGSIPSKKQKEYLKNTSLTAFRYLLEQIFMRSQYNLSEKEEQLASLLSQTSYAMWTDGQRKALDQHTVDYKGEQIPVAKAREILPGLEKSERRDLYGNVLQAYKENSIFAESEINAIVTYKKTIDELRGYAKPYSDRLLNDEIDDQTLESLLAIVTKYFSISKKFYVLHAKLMGEKTVTRADLRSPLGSLEKTMTFNETIKIVKEAFTQVDPKYAEIVQQFIENGQVDVYPKKGKKGGAFCWGVGSLPTYVLLNQVDTIRSVETLAHEMGHAIHGQLDKNLPSYYKGHSTATAEVASTFFEQLVVDTLAKGLAEEDQIVLLHGRLVEEIATIFAQVMGFNYEIELHEKIRAQGQMTHQEIAALLEKHYKTYDGPAVAHTPNDGYSFVGWHHTRYFFYVYSYAYGQLVSRSLYEKWKADPSYAKKIEQFLSAGRSMSPKDIFKSIGINTNEAFFEAGLKGIEADIKKLEKLAKKYKRI